jgi:hypothetical protein
MGELVKMAMAMAKRISFSKQKKAIIAFAFHKVL